MTIKNLLNFFFVLLIFSCGLPTPRGIDWKKEWGKSNLALKELTEEIMDNKDRKYHFRNNDFPETFKYPFDDGFFINYGRAATPINPNDISIRFYLDRGLMDHFSAFIFTNDPEEITMLEQKVKQAANDYKLEDNWYIVND